MQQKKTSREKNQLVYLTSKKRQPKALPSFFSSARRDGTLARLGVAHEASRRKGLHASKGLRKALCRGRSYESGRKKKMSCRKGWLGGRARERWMDGCVPHTHTRSAQAAEQRIIIIIITTPSAIRKDRAMEVWPIRTCQLHSLPLFSERIIFQSPDRIVSCRLLAFASMLHTRTSHMTTWKRFAIAHLLFLHDRAPCGLQGCVRVSPWACFEPRR